MRYTLLLAILLSHVVQVNAAGMIGWNTIVFINQRECAFDNNLEIVLANPNSNPDSCGSSTVIDVRCDSDNSSQLMSMSLVALTSGKQIDAWVDGCDSQGHAKVKTMRLNHN